MNHGRTRSQTRLPCLLPEDTLHDTRLEPTSLAARSCTSKRCRRRHICIAPCVGWPRLSRDGRPEGSLPAFAVRYYCLWTDQRVNLYPLHYRTAFACSLLLYPPPLRLASRLAFPAGCPVGETTGLPRSAAVTVWVRSRLFAGGASAALEEFGASRLDHVPFCPSVPRSRPTADTTKPFSGCQHLAACPL